MIKFNINGGNTLEGNFVAVDPVSKLLVIENEETFNIIFPGQITSIDGELKGQVSEDEAILTMNLNALQKRETSSLETADQSIANINFGVSEDIQTLYDKLSFLFPCRWLGNDIIILDQFIVKSPYGPENITPLESTSQAGLNRIKLVLQGERKKLGL
mmetsp:Transcript_11419/g.11820  ORF Transcript_11419/g.11820 Transcript_11419/m.11820 type:complete len:158 (+) Transcript_11419:98-571(+)